MSNSNREQADVTRVNKRGEMYTVEGISRGKKVSFYIDAKALDSMSRKDADTFMRRNVSNIAQQGE